MKGKFRLMWRVGLALVLALSLGVVMAVPVSAVGALSGLGATPLNYMAGATTTYTIAFTKATDGDVASVDMVFDAAFDVSAAAYSDRSGIGAGTVSVSGQVVTYTVTTPAAITAVTIALSGIVNPSAAAYTPAVTITTKNLAGGAIDTGSANVTITAAPVSFKVETENSGSEVAGTAFTVIITALKADGTTTETQYDGDYLIDFTSTATDATIPAFEVVTFNGSTPGIGTTSQSFVLNVVETGKRITATDSVLNVTGTSDPITVGLAGVGYLTITGAPTSVTAGVAFAGDITVTAYDAYGNVMTTNNSAVSWTSSDGTATAGSGLPVNHNLLAGTWTFSGSDFTLETVGAVAGAQTITATVGTDARSASIIVDPAAASKLSVAAATDPIVADGYDSSVLTATVLDEFNNLVKTSTAVITFETSVGGFTQASGASTYSVAFAYQALYEDYWARATLTSTDGGTATVKVTSGSLTYDTVAVTLTPSTAPTEVWVSLAYSSDVLDGGHEWGVNAFATIEGGTDAVAAGGTVNVAVGTYALANTINIGTAGITLQSTGTTALTIIDASSCAGGGFDGAGILVNAADVIVDGFTVDDAGACGIYLMNAAGAIIRNNVVTNVSAKTGIDVSPTATGVMVSGNTVDEFSDMTVHGSDCMISDNAFSRSILFWPINGLTLEGVTIIDNTFPAPLTQTVNGAINIFGGPGQMSTLEGGLIEGNDLSNRDQAGIRIGTSHGSNLTVTTLTITGNDITNNAEDGIYINSAVTWGAGNTISNNNIVGNVEEAIDNDITTVVIDAENNWWGDATGPFHATTNPAAKGFVVSDKVDYTPWLAASYSAPATTISLESDWNLISLMLRPTDPDIDIVLAGADVTVDKVAYFTGGPAGTWKSWFPSPTPIDLYTMDHGKGYWIDVSAAGELTVTGVELALPGQTPPDYDVVVGWNLIGFTSTTAKTVDVYLGSVLATVEAMYGYNAATGLYEAVLAGNNLASGQGYWLAVNAAGKIYP